jgi:uncharacterized protein (TIGR02757 family)
MTHVPSPLLVRRLETLYAETDGPTRRVYDPVAFVHRYDDPADQEIAGLLAASLAYGRVTLFRPVLDVVFGVLDTHGGPRAFVEGFRVAHAEPLRPLIYRWNRGPDLVWLLWALHDLLSVNATGSSRTLETLFRGEGTARDRLALGVERLRGAMVAAAARDGFEVDGHPPTRFEQLPRGARYLLPSPRTGSACKRWWMFLRWMVRPTTEQIDLGLWSSWSPADLVMPVDVHVSRISRFLGLTTRRDASGRTADEITAALRHIDPADPVRFDFAIAHLGISGDCAGHRQADVCPACPLDAVCQAPRQASGPGQAPARVKGRRPRQRPGKRTSGSKR